MHRRHRSPRTSRPIRACRPRCRSRSAAPAPAIFAPCIADRPMPPRPITATVAPGQTFAVWIAAPDAGGDTASEQACAIERDAVGERDGLGGMHDGSGGERAARQHARERCAVASPAEPGRLGPGVGAAPRYTADALPAAPARHGPGQDDPVAGSHVVHALADLFDDARTFVAEEHRERLAPVPVVASPEVAVTHAARDDPDLDLAGLGLVDLDRLDDDRSACFFDDAPIGCVATRAPVASAGLPILPRVDAGTLRDIAARRYEEFVGALEAMVNVDCGSYTPDGVNVIADLCEARFAANGWEVERRPHRAGDGDPSQLGRPRHRPAPRCRRAERAARRAHGHGVRRGDRRRTPVPRRRRHRARPGRLRHEGRSADGVRRDRGLAGSGLRRVRDASRTSATPTRRSARRTPDP